MSSSEPRKRLIIKISCPKKRANSLTHDSMDDQSQEIKMRKMEHYEKSIVSCYWLDSTISLSQHKKNNNIVVDDHTTEKNKNVSTIDHRYSKNFVGKENLKVLSKDTKDHVGCKNMIKNVNEEELMKKDKKKPMEQYKRMQCEMILRRMVEGRDGWALKHPLDPKYLNGLEKNDSKVMPSCLRDIEAKMKSYSTPNEFAEDMRFVFSHGMLYPPKDDVSKIAKRFSDIFENKWKTLKIEWGFEDRRRLNKSIHKKVLKMQSNKKR